MVDEELRGTAAVLYELGEIKTAFAPLLNGSELPMMEKLIKVAEDRANKGRVRLDKLADAGGDPWQSFAIEKPTLARFKRNVSTTETVESVYRRLVVWGWIIERPFGNKIWITFRIGSIE